MFQIELFLFSDLSSTDQETKPDNYVKLVGNSETKSSGFAIWSQHHVMKLLATL